MELIKETFTKDRNIQLPEQDITQKIIISVLSALIHKGNLQNVFQKMSLGTNHELSRDKVP